MAWAEEQDSERIASKTIEKVLVHKKERTRLDAEIRKVCLGNYQ
jgi:hypothetical protein